MRDSVRGRYGVNRRGLEPGFGVRTQGEVHLSRVQGRSMGQNVGLMRVGCGGIGVSGNMRSVSW